MAVISAFQSDAHLVRRTLADDAGAAESLVLRYQGKARAVVRAAGVREDSVEDLVQDAFLHAFRRLEALRSPGSFGPWFLAIARNAARSHLRRRRPAAAGGIESLDALAGPAALPEGLPGTLEGRELGDALWRSVADLPAGVREAIFLYYHEGRSILTVARALGTSPAAVKDRLHRGREALRGKLWRELRPHIREWSPRRGRRGGAGGGSRSPPSPRSRRRGRGRPELPSPRPRRHRRHSRRP